MELIYKVQTNFMAMIILLFVFAISRQKLDNKDQLNRAFLYFGITIFFGLLFESLTCIINGKDELWLIILSNIMNIGLFTASPLLTFFFLVLMYRIVLMNKSVNKKIMYLLLFPLVISIILAVLSPFFGLYFNIDSLGVYHRGSLFWLATILTYMYMVIGMIILIYNKRKLAKKDFYILLIISILPIIGGIIQGLFYGILLMWSFAALSLMLEYFYLQERMIHLDSLTGSWTRESFFSIYNTKIRNLKEGESFGAIYFDIDNLKAINDNYGHFEGDKAISKAVEIVNNVISSEDIICRLGGDEFIVVIQTSSKTILEDILLKIKKAFKDFEDSKEYSFVLRCSFGADLYSSNFSSLEVFMRHIDSLMYEEKRINRNIHKLDL